MNSTTLKKRPDYILTKTLIRAAIVASLGGLLFGFDTAVIAGTTASISTLYSLSDWSVGFLVSSALIGTIIGTILSSKPSEMWGRRQTLKILGYLFFVSALGCAFAWDYWSLCFFRFIGGLAIGGSSVLGPMYIAEIAPASVRGRLVILFQFNICLGILLAYLSNAIISQWGLDRLQVEWRVMLGMEMLPAVLFTGLLYFIPKSPRWLVMKNRINEARGVLQQIGEVHIERELEEIQTSLKMAAAQTKEELFQKKYAYAIFLGVAVAVFNQFTFINGFLYYLNDTLNEIGATFGGAYQPVIIGLANLIAVVVAMGTIDKFGRKQLLLIGSWGAAIPLILCAYIAYTRTYIELFPWSIATFILFFSYSQGAVIWVYISEVFPNKVRSKGLALGSFTHWALAAVAAQIYPVIVAVPSIGLSIPFLFGAIMLVVQFFVVRRYFVETKGVPLEHLEEKLGITEA
jgi:SP family arabinose:H+ symporter-like MFS transporter